MSLSDLKIKNLKPKRALYRIADGNGLCIEVTPNGSKLWRYRYRFGGRASMLALGSYPDVPLAGRKGSHGIWVKGAREKRDDVRAILGQGINPTAQARSVRAVNTDRSANSFEAV